MIQISVVSTNRFQRLFISALLLSTIVSLAACGGAATPAATDTPAPSAAVAPTAPPAGNAQGQPTSPAAPTPASGGAASSSGQGSGIDLTKINACTLLNEADIQAVMGPVNYSARSDVSASDAFLFRNRECRFVNDVVLMNQDNTGMKQLDLTIWPPDQWADLQNSFGPGTAVSGIGDTAFSADFNLGAGLWVLLNNRAVVQVTVYPKTVDLATQLARKVIARLP